MLELFPLFEKSRLRKADAIVASGLLKTCEDIEVDVGLVCVFKDELEVEAAALPEDACSRTCSCDPEADVEAAGVDRGGDEDIALASLAEEEEGEAGVDEKCTEGCALLSLSLSAADVGLALTVLPLFDGVGGGVVSEYAVFSVISPERDISSSSCASVEPGTVLVIVVVGLSSGLNGSNSSKSMRT